MDNTHYSYNFGFFSCPKSQVESFLIINIFFIVNNTEFLQDENKKTTVNAQTLLFSDSKSSIVTFFLAPCTASQH